MGTRWTERTVEPRHWVGAGQLTVVAVDGSWVGCVPKDPNSRIATVAKLTDDGVLWIRKQDLRECNPQKEKLL
jgi:hypothetical protein